MTQVSRYVSYCQGTVSLHLYILLAANGSHGNAGHGKLKAEIRFSEHARDEPVDGPVGGEKRAHVLVLVMSRACEQAQAPARLARKAKHTLQQQWQG